MKVWKHFVLIKVEVILMDKKRYEARIRWHDKIFIATNGQHDKIRNAVTRLALFHAFGVERQQWDEWKKVETRVFEKYG